MDRMDLEQGEKSRLEWPDNGLSPFYSNIEPEKAAEYLRLALSYLGQNKVPPVPLNYALAYLYSAGVDEKFNEELKRLCDEYQGWEHSKAVSLFLRFFGIDQNGPATAIQQEILGIVRDIVKSTLSVSGSAKARSGALEEQVDRLGQTDDPVEIRAIAGEILQEAKALSAESQYFSKNMENWVGDIDGLQAQLQEARQEAMTDALTGLPNRRSFDKALSQLMETQRPFSLILVDLDHFKAINDEHGHLVGDRVLKQVGLLLKQHAPDNALLARYGGEEFTILLPEHDLSSAIEAAETIRVGIAEARLKRRDTGMLLNVSATFGVGERMPEESRESLILRVDQALYRGKRDGRNQVAPADSAGGVAASS